MILVFTMGTFVGAHESFAQSDAGEKYMPPLKQIRAGVLPDEIKCTDNFERLFKQDGQAICVKPESKTKMMERLGWSDKYPGIGTSETLNTGKTPVEKFPFVIEKEVFDELPESLSAFSYTSNEPIKFESDDEVYSFLQDLQELQNQSGFGHPFRDDRFLAPEPVPEPEPEPESEFVSSPDMERRQIEAGPAHGGVVTFDGKRIEYSTTNVQVGLVDEPDYIKTDGKYVYVVNQNTLTIIEAYPAEEAEIILKAALDIESQNLENMFLNGDRLAILHYGSSQSQGIAEFDFMPYPIYTPNTMITVLDISDREDPVLISQHAIDGNYNDSRMIGNVVYLIATNWIDYHNPIIPRVVTESEIISPEIFRFPNIEREYNFNTIAAVDISSGNMINSEVFLMGYTNSIYMSLDNLYITYEKITTPLSFEQFQKDRFFKVIVPLLPQDAQDKIKEINENPALDPRQKWREVSAVLQEAYNLLPKEKRDELFSAIQKALDEYDSRQDDRHRTVIHKIGLDEGDMEYIANGEVPGYPLNQFSMDEYQGKFRITTTSQNFASGDISNNVYVLDENLDVIGQLEEIAPEERIYSARFMGEKLYLVTFQQIDPFFVIDMSGDSPKILGELKIPGFSNYLQAFDEDHIIGIGRDTELSKSGRVQQLGVKIAMFDVSDFGNPKEKDVIIIGDARTNSEILHNHKALLLDKQKDVMSIPIKTSVSSFDEPFDTEMRFYEDRYWHGFYVYGFDENGFVEKGIITHHQGQDYHNRLYMQPRSFYIDETLYTIMDGSMKMNDLKDVEDEINAINLGHTGKIIPYVN